MMAKRSNPFLDDFIPQSKVHYGVKQFNSSEERLKKVYAKTLELLFKGAKKLPAQELPPNNSDVTNNNKRDTMKQLTIGKNGALEHSAALMEDKRACTPQCVCGKRQLEGSCAYCELQLCACTLYVCSLCERSYCAKCSFVASEGAEVCFSCYP